MFSAEKSTCKEGPARDGAPGIQLENKLLQALEEAAEAGKYFCEEPGRLQASRRWLQSHGIAPAVLRLLEGMLEPWRAEC